jgi:Leucine-rich repeat (LRR) protein
MWQFDDFNKWHNQGRQINENVIELDISSSNIESLGNLENLINLDSLNCCDNQLTSLKGIENLVNLKKLFCCYNKLTSLEGVEKLIKLRELSCKNNQLTSLEGVEKLTKLKKLIKYNSSHSYLHLDYNFSDYYDYVELIELFDKLINNEKIHIIHSLFYYMYNEKSHFDKYVEEIEQMIFELNGFEKYVLK